MRIRPLWGQPQEWGGCPSMGAGVEAWSLEPDCVGSISLPPHRKSHVVPAELTSSRLWAGGWGGTGTSSLPGLL